MPLYEVPVMQQRHCFLAVILNPIDVRVKLHFCKFFYISISDRNTTIVQLEFCKASLLIS